MTAQLNAVFADLRVGAVKTGMLMSGAIVEAVATVLREVRERKIPLVIDPVLTASTGASLHAPGLREALLRELLPLASVLTPNTAEAAALAGMSVRTREDALAAGRRLIELGAAAVLVKGGHLAEPGTDVLVTPQVAWV